MKGKAFINKSKSTRIVHKQRPAGIHKKRQLKGDGLFELDYNLPPDAQRVMEVYGNGKIVAIELRRAPLPGALSAIGNLATMGRMGQQTKQLNVDKFYHLSSVVTLDTGMRLLVEKNQLVNIAVFDGKRDDGMESIQIRGNGVSLKDAFARMQQDIGSDALYKYDVQRANCQDFLVVFVKIAGVYDASTIQWIKQPIEQIVAGLPGVLPKVMKGATNLAAKLQYMWQQRPSWLRR